MAISAAQLLAIVSVQGVKESTSALSEMSHAVDITGGLLSGLMDTALQAGKGLFDFGMQSVKMASDFQAGLTTLVTSAGESVSNLTLVGNGIEQLSVLTGKSTDELIKGMFNIESAGYHGAAGLAVEKAAAEGARIENADLSATTDILTTAMHNYHEPVSQAVDVMNSFREATSLGKMHLDDLNSALKNVLPIASEAGVKLTDVEAAISTMSLAGDKGASAGTHLSQMLTYLLSPSAKATKALKEVGLTTQEISDEMKVSLPGTVQMITDAVGKKFPAGSAAYLAAISAIVGGNKSMKAILELSGQSLKTFTDDASALGPLLKANAKDVDGWSTVQQNFNYQMDVAQQAVNVLMIKIGSALLPVLGKLFQAVPGIIVQFTEWIDKAGILNNITQTLVGWIGYVGDAFNQVFNPIQKAQQAMAPLTDTFDRATSVLHETAKVAAPLTDTFDRATAILGQNKKAVQDTTNVWIPFWQEVKHVRDQFMTIDWNAVGKGFDNIRVAISKMDWGKIGALFSDIADAIAHVNWDNVGANFQKIAIALTKVDWGKVSNNIVIVLDNLSKVDWGSIMKGIIGAINGIQNLVGWFTWAYNILLGHSIIPDMINGIIQWFAQLPGRLLSLAQTMVNNVVNAIAQLPGRIGGAISGVFGALVTPFQNAANVIQNTLNGIHLPHIPGIPGFASGVENFSGGMAYVHAGEVITYLPPGSSVTPANKVSSMMSQGSNQPLNVNVYLDGARLTGKLMPHIAQSLRYGLGVHGV